MGMRQTRVFVPATEPEEGWAETLIGSVFRPLTEEFAEYLDWFWFSRYGATAEDLADCDIARVPAECKRSLDTGGIELERSLRFRYAVANEQQESFEQRALQLIAERGYGISDFRLYDFVGDTGSNRFLGNENRLPGRAQQRAQLVTQLYVAISRLVIDALVGPDKNGRYRVETNDDLVENPNASTFQSLHHLFCNITSVPTELYVFRKEGLNVLGFGTFVYPPPPPPGGWDEFTAHTIWF